MFILADVAMIVGIIGGLMGSRLSRRGAAASPEAASRPSESTGELPAPKTSKLMGVLGGGGSALSCVALTVAAAIVAFVCLIIFFLVLALGFGIGMQ